MGDTGRGDHGESFAVEEEWLDVMEELGSGYHVRKACNVVPCSGRRLRVYMTGARLPDSVHG